MAVFPLIFFSQQSQDSDWQSQRDSLAENYLMAFQPNSDLAH
jgi:hypothetical protein